MCFLDIRKVAQRVNKKLKDLITVGDDDDSSTDIFDQIQVNLLSGSPRKVARQHDNVEESSEGKVSDTTSVAGKSEQQVVDPNKFSLLTVLGVLIPHMRFTEQETRLETLRWLLWLHQKLPRRVSDIYNFKTTFLLVDMNICF